MNSEQKVLTVRRKIFVCSLLALITLLISLGPAPVQAQGYAKLQVLLPGESPAPGTVSGKAGSPLNQVLGTPFEVSVRAVDANWNLMSAITSTVELTSSNSTASLPANFVLSGGAATVQVTLNAAGSFTFTADDQTDPTIPLATSASVTALQLQGFEFSRINQKNQYAGQPMAITLEAISPTGQRVTGYSGTVQLQQLTSFGDGRISPSSVNLVNGVWAGDVTMFRADQTSINRGNVNIYAFLPQDPTRNGTSDPFTVHPGSFRRVQLVVPGQTAAPGSVTGVLGSPASQGSGRAFTATVYATDDYFNPVPSSDQVRITSSDPAASTPVNGTMSNGVASIGVTLASVGQQTLTVTDLTNGSINGMTSPPIAVTSGSVDRFVVEPIAGSVTAGVPVTVTIRATDTAGNTITDYQGDGVLTANTGPGSISPTSINFTNGEWTGSMTFRGAGGAVALSCADYSSPPHTGTSASFEVLAGPYVGLQVIPAGQQPAGGTASGVSGIPTVQAAGSTFDIRVRAVDAYFNRVPGNTARFELSSTDLHADLGAVRTLVNGELLVSVTLFASGDQSITARDVDDTGKGAGTSSPIDITAGPYARLVLLAPGQQLAPGTEEGRSGDATDQSISYAFTVLVFATDTWGNPVFGSTDEVRITSNDPLAELPPQAAMTDGVGSFVLRLSTGGFQQITASNVTNPAITSSTTQVRAISSGLHLEAFVTPSTVRAGDPFTLSVRVTNDAGAVIQEINSTVTVQVRNASEQTAGRGTLQTTQFQLLQGQRNVSQTYTYAEDIVFLVSDDLGNLPATSNTLRVLPGAPDAIELSSDPEWVRGNRNTTVTSRVVDAFGNGVPDRPIDFTVIMGLGSIEALVDSTGADGVALARFTAPRQPEMGRIRATSGALVQELAIETALVDPSAPGGSVTNYPNPFHPGEAPTTVAYKLDNDAFVRIRLYTLLGNLVLEETFDSGRPGGMASLNEWQWDGRNGNGDFVASGGYILEIHATAEGETLHSMRRKIAVVR